MPNPPSVSEQSGKTNPDYLGLVRFLLSPFLESPDSLSLDCEQSNHNQRVLVRVAFDGTDKGRVYGRGGRNLQAIRTVLATAAALAGQSLSLDIYDSQPNEKSSKRDNDRDFRQKPDRRSRSNRPPSPRSQGKPRSG